MGEHEHRGRSAAPAHVVEPRRTGPAQQAPADDWAARATETVTVLGTAVARVAAAHAANNREAWADAWAQFTSVSRLAAAALHRAQLHDPDRVAPSRAMFDDLSNRAQMFAYQERGATAAGPQPLPSPLRGALENATSTSLAHVRLHAGDAGNAVAARHDARAVAIGSDIFVAEGQLDPASRDGVALLAHEVAHVVQAMAVGGSGPIDDAEGEADAFASEFIDSGGAMSWRPSVAIASGTAMRAPAAAPIRTTKRSSLPAGVDYQHVGGLALRVRRSWLESDPGWRAKATRSLAPTRARTLLEELRAKGAIGWATPEAIGRAASSIAITTAGATEVVVVQWDAQLYNVIGLPPGAMFGVTVRGSSAIMTVASAELDVPSGRQVPLGAAQLHAFVAALTEGLGLTPLPDTESLLERLGAAKTVKAYGGKGLFTITADRDTLVGIFGEDQIAWWEGDRKEQAAKAPPQRGSATATGGIPTARHDLTPEEAAELMRWLEQHLHGDSSIGHQLLDRAMLMQVRAIQADPNRPRILEAIAKLQARKGAHRVASPGELDALIQHAKVEAFSLERVPFEVRDPMNAMPVPARIRQHAGLVTSGEDVPLSIEIDWPPELTQQGGELFRRRIVPHVADIEWIFSKQVELPPPDLVRHHRYVGGSGVLKHRFVLETHEDEAVWKVTALVRHTHFLPAYLTTEIQVRTERLRMAELREQAGYDAMGSVATSDHDFQTSLYNEAFGDEAYDHGKRLEGTLPKDFASRTSAQRRGQRAAERQRMVDMIEYLRDRPGSGDAREAAQWHIDRLAEADRDIAADEKAGLRSFEVRATFLSREPGVADGALDLYGTVSAPKRRERRFRGHGEYEVIVDEVVRVQLRDLSRRFESETYAFTGEATTFAAALEAAFVKLAKAYPPGRMSLLAQSSDERSGAATGKTLGFELDTGTAWKDHKAKVFAPIAQRIVMIASMAAMVFFPAAAPAVMAASIAYNGVDSIDAILQARDKGTLTGSKLVINLGSIALDLIPMIGRATRLGTTRAGLWVLEGIDHGSQIALMTGSAREAIVAQKEMLIVALAEQYEQLIALERTLDPSDPKLAAARAAIDAKAKEVSKVTYQVFEGLIGEQALTFGVARAFHKAGHVQMTRELGKLADAGAFENIAGSPPHYDHTRGVVVGDPKALDLAALRALEQQRTAHLQQEAEHFAHKFGVKPEHVEIVLGDKLALQTAKGRVTLTYKPGISLDRAQSTWESELSPQRLATYRDGVGGGARASLAPALGERIAKAAGARYAGHGVFEVDTEGGVVDVEMRRTAGKTRVTHLSDHRVLVEVPKGLSAAELEPAVAVELAKIQKHHHEAHQRGPAHAVSDHLAIHHDIHGPPILETTATRVPGSAFRGRNPGGERGAAVLAEAREALSAALRMAGDIDWIEPVNVAQILKPRDKPRAEQTFVVKLKPVGNAPGETFTIRLAVGPLEGETVARSIINPTQRGRSPTASGVHKIEGRYVIQLSNELDTTSVQRALAHEVAEIRAIRTLAARHLYPGQDALVPGASGTHLSPHDRGRLAEIEVLVAQLANPATQAHARTELAALVEHLGLREGTDGASTRFELAAEHLSANARRELESARRDAAHLDAAARAELETIRIKAQTHTQEDAARRAAKASAHDMPSSLDSDGRPLTHEALKARAEGAAKAREEKSKETWDHLQALHAAAPARGERHPLLPWVAQIGGGASLAGRDRNHLLIDDRGRWQVDGASHLAQTGMQLKETKDAGLGDPTTLVGPKDRLPMDAVRYWEDNIAAQGPVVNGRAAMRIDDSGDMVLDITVGESTLTFRVDKVPVVATGFVPERLPDAPFGGLGPVQTAAQVQAKLQRFLRGAPDGAAKDAARIALDRLKQTPMSTHADAAQLPSILGDQTLQRALDGDPVIRDAIRLGRAAVSWQHLRATDNPDHPHVFLGDGANIGVEHAKQSNNFAIGGTGGTGVSAAEIVLKNNPKAHVTMVGTDDPAGLMENDQFFTLAEKHGDAGVAAMLQVPVGDGRLSILNDRVGAPQHQSRAEWEAARSRTTPSDNWVDESNIDPSERSRSIYDANGQHVHTQASTYVAALGRNDDYPPIVAALIDQARRKGWNHSLQPILHDRQYGGYTVTILLPGDRKKSVDVTGAASRFIPNDDAHMSEPARVAFASARSADDWDAPAESGNFAGGFAATSTQAARYASWRKHEVQDPQSEDQERR